MTLAKDHAPMTDASMLHHIGSQAVKAAPPVVVTTIAMLGKGLPFIISVMTLLYLGIQMGYLIWRWHSQYEDRRARRAAHRATVGKP